jgi:hypothetical protein
MGVCSSRKDRARYSGRKEEDVWSKPPEHIFYYQTDWVSARELRQARRSRSDALVSLIEKVKSAWNRTQAHAY